MPLVTTFSTTHHLFLLVASTPVLMFERRYKQPHSCMCTVLQVLNWSFLALRGDFNMNLAMHEEPQQLRIRTELLQGSMMRRFSSSVGVTRTGPGACRLTMDLYMQPTVPVPFGIRHMVGHQVSTVGYWSW
jgi:hypothetical protein